MHEELPAAVHDAQGAVHGRHTPSLMYSVVAHDDEHVPSDSSASPRMHEVQLAGPELLHVAHVW